MFGHENFAKVQDRWESFWEGGNESPLFSITVPKNGKEIAPAPLYLAGFNGNYQAVADTLARWYDSCMFFGEAIPYYQLEFGADTFASYLGADLMFGTNAGVNTSWPTHTITQLKNVKIAFDKNGKWWNRTVEFYYGLKKTLGETVMISAPTLVSGLDAIVALYGAENLLYDLIDEPEAVHEALEQLNAAYTGILNEYAKLFEFDKYGSINRHGMYSKGRIGVPQCDFSVMLSPEMFEEFEIPCLEHEFNQLDAGEYHLDGSGAIKHLERLAEIQKLHVIQWVPDMERPAGADHLPDGLNPFYYWTDLYKKIVSLGKGVLLGTNPIDGDNREYMTYMQNELKTPRIFAIINGIKSKDEAENYLGERDALFSCGIDASV